MPTRIAITGGSGFIGVNLVEYFLSRGHVLLNLDIAPPRNVAQSEFWSACDLRDADLLINRLKAFKPEWVLHLGARTDLDGAAVADYSANTLGLSNLIDAIQRCDSVQRLMFFSSRLVCRNGYVPKDAHDYCPSTAYGCSKVDGERLIYSAAASLPPWTIVRPTSIWGPWFDIPYRTFFNVVRRGMYLHPRGRSVPKSFGYVGNLAYQTDRLMTAPDSLVSGRMFYLCDSPPLVMPDFARRVSTAFGAPPVREVPLPLLRTAAWFGDVFKTVGWRNPPLTGFRLENILMPMEFDTHELDSICGPSPHSVDQGIKATVEWMLHRDPNR